MKRARDNVTADLFRWFLQDGSSDFYTIVKDARRSGMSKKFRNGSGNNGVETASGLVDDRKEMIVPKQL